LLWLDADTLIRKLTNDKKSLDDFEKIFLGKGGNTGPLIVPYTFDELVTDLNQVTPYDWATFLHDRVDKINPRADVAGIEQGGYKLVFHDKPTASERIMDNPERNRRGGLNCWYSIGVHIGSDGHISDVRWNGPADQARLAPGDKIIAVNGIVFSNDVLRDAIRAAKAGTEPIHLLVQADSFVRAAELNYHDGERYPALERVDGTPAYLDEIIKPLTKPEVVAEKSKEDSDD
jgi:predicted metalloprotease with PDZ domain